MASNPLYIKVVKVVKSTWEIELWKLADIKKRWEEDVV